jgi:hypothetical protein
MFPVYGGKCLSRKTVHNWWQTFCWWRLIWNGGAEVAEATVKRLLCCGFRRTGKAMGQVYQCWCKICREINFFSGWNITCFTFYIHLRPVYWISLLNEGTNWSFGNIRFLMGIITLQLLTSPDDLVLQDSAAPLPTPTRDNLQVRLTSCSQSELLISTRGQHQHSKAYTKKGDRLSRRADAPLLLNLVQTSIKAPAIITYVSLDLSSVPPFRCRDNAHISPLLPSSSFPVHYPLTTRQF